MIFIISQISLILLMELRLFPDGGLMVFLCAQKYNLLFQRVRV